MTTTWLDTLHGPAVEAFEDDDAAATEGLRRLGAALAFHDRAMNGGLVGGAIETLFFADDLAHVDEAISAFHWLGMTEAAAVVDRARAEYLRFRPTGEEEISDEDARLWDALDDEFYAVADDDRLERAIEARSREILPA